MEFLCKIPSADCDLICIEVNNVIKITRWSVAFITAIRATTQNGRRLLHLTPGYWDNDALLPKTDDRLNYRDYRESNLCLQIRNTPFFLVCVSSISSITPLLVALLGAATIWNPFINNYTYLNCRRYGNVSNRYTNYAYAYVIHTKLRSESFGLLIYVQSFLQKRETVIGYQMKICYCTLSI